MTVQKVSYHTFNILAHIYANSTTISISFSPGYVQECSWSSFSPPWRKTHISSPLSTLPCTHSHHPRPCCRVPICQKDRLPQQLIPHPTAVETILHHKRSIGIDHISLLPTDEDGYIGLLLIVEHDTKFPYAYAVRDYTAHTVAITLFKHYCTFGSFDSIYSDPGSALLSSVVSELNTWLGRHNIN